MKKLMTRLHIFEGRSGSGVRTEESIDQGVIVAAILGTWVDKPTRYTLQVSEERHLLPGGQLWALVNHSCTPNLRVDIGKMGFVALRTIATSEELTFNYLSTEWFMAEPFQCNCESADCIGWIAGFSLLSACHHERMASLMTEFIAQKNISRLLRNKNEIISF